MVIRNLTISYKESWISKVSHTLHLKILEIQPGCHKFLFLGFTTLHIDEILMKLNQMNHQNPSILSEFCCFFWTEFFWRSMMKITAHTEYASWILLLRDEKTRESGCSGADHFYWCFKEVNPPFSNRFHSIMQHNLMIFPTVFLFSPTKLTFSPRPSSLFPHLSNYCSDTNPKPKPKIKGRETLNAAARFMTYPKL